MPPFSMSSLRSGEGPISEESIHLLGSLAPFFNLDLDVGLLDLDIVHLSNLGLDVSLLDLDGVQMCGHC